MPVYLPDASVSFPRFEGHREWFGIYSDHCCHENCEWLQFRPGLLVSDLLREDGPFPTNEC